MRCTLALVLAFAASATTLTAQDTAQDTASPAKPARPTFDADGMTRVPAFELPASLLSSPESRDAHQAIVDFFRANLK